VHSIVPRELEWAVSGDELLRRLPEFDSEMEEIKKAAQKQDKVVRYVGKIDVAAKAVTVGLEAYDKSHPIAVLKGSDNMISF